MKFEIRITELTEFGLKGLVKFLEKHQAATKKVDEELKVWANRRKVSPEAPYGLKKDGTPRKRVGRPAGKKEKK